MRALAPPTTELSDVVSVLKRTGFAAISRPSIEELVAPAVLSDLAATWADLPPDPYLRDGGHYRFRRHSSFIVEPSGAVTQVAHRPHFQPVEYNALHGGFERWFVPMAAEVAESAEFRSLLVALSNIFFEVKPVEKWFVEAHQFRIDTTGGIGRPTPEGAHRDGVDFVTVSLVSRVGVKGGETRVFDAEGPSGMRFTMDEPWTTLLLDDARMIHETTPIQPVQQSGYRDTLVLTFRSQGFQGILR